MTKLEKRQEMLQLAEQCLSSGMSQLSYAREHNIKIHTLRYWLTRYRQQQQSTGAFIQLQGLGTAGIHLHYPNGVELTLPVQTPLAMIKSLISYT
jgi:hypothetical protein